MFAQAAQTLICQDTAFFFSWTGKGIGWLRCGLCKWRRDATSATKAARSCVMLISNPRVIFPPCACGSSIAPSSSNVPGHRRRELTSINWIYSFYLFIFFCCAAVSPWGARVITNHIRRYKRKTMSFWAVTSNFRLHVQHHHYQAWGDLFDHFCWRWT